MQTDAADASKSKKKQQWINKNQINIKKKQNVKFKKNTLETHDDKHWEEDGN